MAALLRHHARPRGAEQTVCLVLYRRGTPQRQPTNSRGSLPASFAHPACDGASKRPLHCRLRLSVSVSRVHTAHSALDLPQLLPRPALVLVLDPHWLGHGRVRRLGRTRTGRGPRTATATATAIPMRSNRCIGQLPDSGWPLELFGSSIVVPVAEELAFRGYLLRRLIDADFTAVSPRQVTATLSSSHLGCLDCSTGAGLPASSQG